MILRYLVWVFLRNSKLSSTCLLYEIHSGNLAAFLSDSPFLSLNSYGCLITSKTERLNSGNLSKNKTPLCVRDIHLVTLSFLYIYLWFCVCIF